MAVFGWLCLVIVLGLISVVSGGSLLGASLFGGISDWAWGVWLVIVGIFVWIICAVAPFTVALT